MILYVLYVVYSLSPQQVEINQMGVFRDSHTCLAALVSLSQPRALPKKLFKHDTPYIKCRKERAA